MLKRRGESKATAITTDDNAATESTGNVSNEQLGSSLSREETVKQKMAYLAAARQTTTNNNTHEQQQMDYVAEKIHANDDASMRENDSYVFARDNVLGLSRAETVKQQMEYTAATATATSTSQQNQHASVSSIGNEVGSVSTADISRLSNNSTAVARLSNNSSLVARVSNNSTVANEGPGVIRIVPSTHDSVEPADLEREQSNSFTSYNIPIARPVRELEIQEADLVTDAEPVLPFYKQKRILIALVSVAAAAAAVAVGLTIVIGKRTRQPDASQTAALVALYVSTNGSSWTRNDNWLLSGNVSVCTWYGVTCDGDVVTELNLSYNNLVGSIPSEIEHLIQLERLELDFNSLTGTIPSTLGKLNFLQVMFLDTNYLTGTIPTEFGRLSSLQDLGVHMNDLTGTMPNEVCSLRTTNGGAQLDSLAADCYSDMMCTCCNTCY